MTSTRYYKLKVEIRDPETNDIETLYRPDVWFSTDDENYGNGTYLKIDGSHYYDIRYDTSYDPKHEMAYITQWAENYWSGENGAWKLHSIDIERVEEQK